MVRFIVSVAGLCVSSTALMAGGMERTALSTGFMYENGGYAEGELIRAETIQSQRRHLHLMNLSSKIRLAFLWLQNLT
jgi:hypothetical protein